MKSIVRLRNLGVNIVVVWNGIAEVRLNEGKLIGNLARSHLQIRVIRLRKKGRLAIDAVNVGRNNSLFVFFVVVLGPLVVLLVQLTLTAFLFLVGSIIGSHAGRGDFFLFNELLKPLVGNFWLHLFRFAVGMLALADHRLQVVEFMGVSRHVLLIREVFFFRGSGG